MKESPWAWEGTFILLISGKQRLLYYSKLSSLTKYNNQAKTMGHHRPPRYYQATFQLP